MPLRQAVGILLVLVLLAGGRALRHRLLVGPDGAWLPAVVGEAAPAFPAAGTDAAAAAPALTAPLPINTCSPDSLRLLPGVGPVLAGRIAQARVDGLVFRRSADLEAVKGIGPRLAARLDSLVLYAPPPAESPGPTGR